jgi:hypothetical protein
MNHNDNTSGYILSNYLSNIFHLHQRRPSSDPEDARTPRDPDGVLSCVMPCINPNPRPPKRMSRPDPICSLLFCGGEREREGRCKLPSGNWGNKSLHTHDFTPLWAYFIKNNNAVGDQS